MTRDEYLEILKGLTKDISDEAEGEALEALTSEIYFDDSPDPEDVKALKSLNLLGFLQEEIGKENYDVGRVKVIFRALRLAKPKDSIVYIISNFSELVVFAKEVSLLMQALEQENKGCFDDLTDSVVSAILEPPASSVQLIRTWLLDLFVRGTVPLSPVQFLKIENLPSLLDKRQLHLIRSRIDGKNYFRMNKAALGHFPFFEQSAFIAGAACLPKDEYEAWLLTLKPTFSGPTCHLFLKWLKDNKGKIIAKLGSPVDEHIE